MLSKWFKKINNKKVRIKLYGFNYEGSHDRTAHSLVAKYYSDHEDFINEGNDQLSYLSLPDGLVDDFFIDNLKIIDKINQSHKDKSDSLNSFLESNKDKHLVLYFDTSNSTHSCHKVVLLEYKNNQWQKVTYR